jgi:sulfatase modifying factor 1
MSNFDLSELALKAVCPNNEIIYDNKGMPSVMVRIPKMTLKDAGLGDSTATFPAFIVNGREVDEIYIGKYLSCVQNERAYSLPAVAPKNFVSFDQAAIYCANKGEGWHLMSGIEYAALMHWCAVRGITPIGNNNYGKHNSESQYTAIAAEHDSEGKTHRTLTGTGPLSYSHDGTLSGIWDLCGNVWDIVGGMRIVYGEVQVLANNNGADTAISQANNGASWKAINATTGELITPNGSGTTPNSIKMDWVSNNLQYDTNITDQERGGHWFDLSSATCATSIGEKGKLVLQQLGLLLTSPTEFKYGSWSAMNNAEGEKIFYRGGGFGSAGYGFPSLGCDGSRGDSHDSIGFRLAYVKLPTAG